MHSTLLVRCVSSRSAQRSLLLSKACCCVFGMLGRVFEAKYKYNLEYNRISQIQEIQRCILAQIQIQNPLRRPLPWLRTLTPAHSNAWNSKLQVKTRSSKPFILYACVYDVLVSKTPKSHDHAQLHHRVTSTSICIVLNTCACTYMYTVMINVKHSNLHAVSLLVTSRRNDGMNNELEPPTP